MTRIVPTLAEIAADFRLWGEYYDVDGLDTFEQWTQLGQSARMELLREAFGAEPCREYDQHGRLIYFRGATGHEEWYNPDAPSGQQTIRASAWDGCHDISYPQEA